GVEVGMAVETRHAQTRLGDLAILGLVEFFLREGREQHAQPLHLNGRDEPVEDLVVVADGQQLTARHVAELWLGSEKDRRREFRREMVRQVEVDMEAAEIALFLARDLINLPVREDLPAGQLLYVGERL